MHVFAYMHVSMCVCVWCVCSDCKSAFFFVLTSDSFDQVLSDDSILCPYVSLCVCPCVYEHDIIPVFWIASSNLNFFVFFFLSFPQLVPYTLPWRLASPRERG